MSIHVKVLSSRIYTGQLVAEIQTTNTDYPAVTIEMNAKLSYMASTQDLVNEINQMARTAWAAYPNPEWDVPEV